MTTLLVVFLIFVGMFAAVKLSIDRKTRRLAQVRSGATRIETVKASHADMTVRQYTGTGWAVVNQSSAKSLGSQARVTITFRKV